MWALRGRSEPIVPEGMDKRVFRGINQNCEGRFGAPAREDARTLNW